MKSKLLIIISSIILAIGLVILLIGGYMSGWDIIGWFSSTYAMWFYVCLGIWLVIFLYCVLRDKINKL